MSAGLDMVDGDLAVFCLFCKAIYSIGRNAEGQFEKM
jgi:hypothetical protein